MCAVSRILKQMKFKLFGTEIEITFLFSALITFMLFTDKSGLLVPVSVSVILHESAHLLCMRILKCQPKKIRLIPTSIEVIRGTCSSPQHEIFISAAGSAVNLVVFVLLFKINTEFAAVNLIIGLFNLLPLPALDGGEILKNILNRKLSNKRVNLVMKIITVTAVVAVLCISFYLMLNGKANISAVIMSVYFFISVIVKL